MRRIVIVICIIVGGAATAQTDSLFSAFNRSKVPDERLALAYEITKKYITSSPETALKYLHLAVKEGGETKDLNTLGLCYNAMSACYYYMGDSKSTAKYAKQAIATLLKTDDEEGLQKARKNLALSLDEQGQFEGALKVYFELLKYHSQQQDSVKSASVLNDIGNIYIKTKNYSEAFKYQRNALRQINPFPEGEQIKGNILNSIGYLHDVQNLRDSAIFYYEQALEIKRNAGNIVGLNNTLNNLCTCIDYKKEADKSIRCLKELLITQEIIGDQKGIIRTHINLSVAYNSQGKCNEALDNLEKASKYSSQIKDLLMQVELAKNYSQTLFNCGEFKKAYEIRQHYETYNDSLLNIGKQQAILELNEKYETRQKEEQIKLLELQKKSDRLLIQKQRSTILLVIISVVLLGILTYFFFERYRVKQKQKKDQEVLKRREEERLRIARDMHDEVGSGLTRMVFRSEQARKHLQSNDFSAEELAEKLDKLNNESRQLSKNIGEIIWALNPKNDNLDNFIAYLRNYIYDYLDEVSIERELDFPDELPSIPVSPDLRRNLFLIVKEILTNVVKHAHATRVAVQVELKNKDLILLIIDNGKGINKEAAKPESNGLVNMENRTKDCGGHIEIKSSSNGTSIRITIPNFTGEE